MATRRLLIAALAIAALVAVLAATLVVARPAPAPQQLSGTVSARCPSDTPRDQLLACLRDLVTDPSVGAEPALAAMAELLPSRPDIARLCHGLFHEVGEQQGRLRTAADLVARFPYSCFGGYWHGFLSGRGEQVALEALVAEVSGLCSSLAGQPDIVLFDCNHGVGHGLGMTKDGTLATSLQACLEAVSVDRVEACATGVASAYATRTAVEQQGGTGHGSPPGPEARWPEAARTCSALQPAVLARACWGRMAAFAHAAGQTSAEIAQACERAGAYRDSCARSEGFFVGALVDPQRTQDALRSCGAFAPDLQKPCYSGILEQSAPVEKQTGMRTGLCKAVPPALRQWCTGEHQRFLDRELSLAAVEP